MSARPMAVMLWYEYLIYLSISRWRVKAKGKQRGQSCYLIELVLHTSDLSALVRMQHLLPMSLHPLVLATHCPYMGPPRAVHWPATGHARY
jgi:hypothetical protein